MEKGRERENIERIVPEKKEWKVGVGDRERGERVRNRNNSWQIK